VQELLEEAVAFVEAEYSVASLQNRR